MRMSDEARHPFFYKFCGLSGGLRPRKNCEKQLFMQKHFLFENED